MAEKKFELGDYVEVRDRIKILYELYGDARLVTEEVTLTREPDDKPRVMVKALAYRTSDDPHPGVGYSWLELPGRTPYTNGSELENAETSAWGRAIAALGILLDKSIASQQEIQNKADGQPALPEKLTSTEGETIRDLGPIERTGAIAKGSGRHSDLEWRQTPDGYHIGFLLEVGDGKPKPQVSIEGPLAVSLFAAVGKEPLLGLKVTVKGTVLEIKQPARRTFYRIVAESIATDEWIIPSPVEAPTEPLGLVEPSAEEKELDELPW